MRINKFICACGGHVLPTCNIQQAQDVVFRRLEPAVQYIDVLFLV